MKVKIKDLFKKVEASNEIAKLTNNDEVQIWFESDYILKSFKTYKDYLAYIKETFVKELYDPMKNVEFNYGLENKVSGFDIFGHEYILEFEFGVERCWVR